MIVRDNVTEGIVFPGQTEGAKQSGRKTEQNNGRRNGKSHASSSAIILLRTGGFPNFLPPASLGNFAGPLFFAKRAYGLPEQFNGAGSGSKS